MGAMWRGAGVKHPRQPMRMQSSTGGRRATGGRDVRRPYVHRRRHPGWRTRRPGLDGPIYSGTTPM